MAEEKKKRKRKGVTAAAAEPVAAKPEEPAAKPVQSELPLVPSGPLPETPKPARKLVVQVDNSEYELIRTYARLFNEEHEGIEGFTKIDEGQYLLLATLRWIEYTERAAAEGMEAGEEEDVTPPEPSTGPAVSAVDPVDDDPEFVEAWASRVTGSQP